MELAISYPHVEKIEGEPARLTRFPRIRIAQLVMDYVAHGWSAEEMCRQHAYLTMAEAHAAMLYYWDHQAEIDGEIRNEIDEAIRQKDTAAASPFVLRMSRDKA